MILGGLHDINKLDILLKRTKIRVRVKNGEVWEDITESNYNDFKTLIDADEPVKLKIQKGSGYWQDKDMFPSSFTEEDIAYAGKLIQDKYLLKTNPDLSMKNISVEVTETFNIKGKDIKIKGGGRYDANGYLSNLMTFYPIF